MKIIQDHVTNGEEKTNSPPPATTGTEAQFVNAQGATVTVPNTNQNNQNNGSNGMEGEKKGAKTPIEDEKVAPKDAPRKLMTVEERRVGHVGASIYKQYLSAFPGIIIDY